MRRRFLNLTACLCALIVMLPVLIFVYTGVQQRMHYAFMKERLETEHLQTISIPSSSVHWIKAGKEILLNGELFDIESSREQEGIITFTGLIDEKEKEINRHVAAFREHEEQRSKNTSSAWFLSFFDNHDTNYSFTPPQVFFIQIDKYKVYWPVATLNTETPPPDQLFFI